jgi:hypothetical protein
MKHRPSNAVVIAVAGVEEASAAFSFVGGAICAPAATVGGEGIDAVKTVAQWRRWRLPVTGCAPSQIGIEEYRWGMAAEGEPRTESRPSPHLYI